MTSSEESSYLDAGGFIELAIRFERDSVRFYRDLGGRVGAEDARDLLRMLEGEEARHAAALEELESTAGFEGLIQFPPAIELSMPGPPGPDAGVDELIGLAIERERRSALIYEHAAGSVTGPFRELLEGLAAFEREHESRLQSLRKYY